MRLKKGLSLLFALFLMVALISCGKTNTEVQNGWIRGRVLLENDTMLVSGLVIQNEVGKSWHTTTDLLGAYDVELAPGTYTITFTRGAEYSVVTQEVKVVGYRVTRVADVSLEKLTDLYAKGWISGDLHMHSTYSDGANSPAEQLLSNLSQGLHFGFLTDHNTNAGIQEWLGGNAVVADIDEEGNLISYSACAGTEVTTHFGHYLSLGTNVTYDSSLYSLTKEEQAKTGDEYNAMIEEKIIAIAETIRANGGIPQINHPYSTRNMGFPRWDLVDYFDTIEIWNGAFVPGDGRYEGETYEQNYQAKLTWYELLNEVKNGGKFHAATCGTDNHNVTASYTASGDVSSIETMADYNEAYYSNGRYSGVPTLYVYCPGEVTSSRLLGAVVAGHSFLSNGVTVLANVNGASYGDTAQVSGQMVLTVDAFCRDGLEKIRVVKNGEVFTEIVLDGTAQQYDTPISLDGIQAGDWIVLEVLGTETRYAITNPIFFA